MVGTVPIALVLRDAFLAAGQGFLLAVLYRFARLFLGDKAALVALCDSVLFVLGALFYRSATMSIFVGGTMRWYTAISLLCGYALCVQMLQPPFRAMRSILCKPFSWLMEHVLRTIGRKIAEMHKKRREKVRVKQIKDLPKQAKVLYNSN